MSRFYFNSEIVPLVCNSLIDIVNCINGIKDEMRYEYTLLEKNTGFGIDEALQRMQSFESSDKFSAQALDAVKALTDIGRLVEGAENKAAAVDYGTAVSTDSSSGSEYYGSTSGSSESGHSSGGGRHDSNGNKNYSDYQDTKCIINISNNDLKKIIEGMVRCSGSSDKSLVEFYNNLKYVYNRGEGLKLNKEEYNNLHKMYLQALNYSGDYSYTQYVVDSKDTYYTLIDLGIKASEIVFRGGEATLSANRNFETTGKTTVSDSGKISTGVSAGSNVDLINGSFNIVGLEIRDYNKIGDVEIKTETKYGEISVEAKAGVSYGISFNDFLNKTSKSKSGDDLMNALDVGAENSYKVTGLTHTITGIINEGTYFNKNVKSYDEIEFSVLGASAGVEVGTSGAKAGAGLYVAKGSLETGVIVDNYKYALGFNATLGLDASAEIKVGKDTKFNLGGFGVNLKAGDKVEQQLFGNGEYEWIVV